MKQVNTRINLNSPLNDKDLKDQRLYQMYIFDPKEAEPAQAKIETSDGVRAHEMRKLKSVRVRDKTKFASKIAIIGYWKLNSRGKYRCYYHFKVPNPVTHDIRKKKDS